MGLHARCDEILAMIDAVIGPTDTEDADRGHGPASAADTANRDCRSKEATQRPEP